MSCPCVQASYSKDGIFIGAAATCTRQDAAGSPLRQELSALYVLPKHSICEPPSRADEDPDRSTPQVFAAVYFAHRAWYRSVAEGELVMVEDKFEPFNSNVAPARPQNEEDLHEQPLFAMKVRVLACLLARILCMHRPLRLINPFCSGSDRPHVCVSGRKRPHTETLLLIAWLHQLNCRSATAT